MTTLTVLSSDGSNDVHTITKAEYDARDVEPVHFVRSERTGGVDE